MTKMFQPIRLFLFWGFGVCLPLLAQSKHSINMYWISDIVFILHCLTRSVMQIHSFWKHGRMKEWIAPACWHVYKIQLRSNIKRETMENPVIHLPPVGRRVRLSDSLTKNSIGKEKSHNVTAEKPSKHSLSLVIRQAAPGCRVTLPSAEFFPRAHSCSLTTSKTTEKARLGDSLQDAWPVPLKNIKVIERKREKGKTEQLSHSKRTGETGQPYTMWRPGSDTGTQSAECGY